LGNPEAEEFEKISTDHVKEVSNVFPGQIRVFEIETYLKTIPTLLNSDEGKQIVANNLMLLNDGKIIKYKVGEQILKDNNGIPPRNFDMLINERAEPELERLGEELEKGMTDAIEKYQPTIEMYGPDGKVYEIPYTKVSQAASQGLTLQKAQ
jgi:hypothetical protein